MENLKNELFVKLQFALLLGALTLLPEFSFSGMFGFDFDIPVLICKLVALIAGGMALYKMYQNYQEGVGNVYFIVTGVGLLCLLLSIFGVATWLDYVGLAALFVAVGMGKNSLGITWNTIGSQGAYMIFLAVLLYIFLMINETICTKIAALIGLIMYFIGLKKFAQPLDANGAAGASKLRVAVILGLIGVIFALIPLIGGIIAGILGIIAFIFEFIGYGSLKKCVTIGELGQGGAGKLRNSMIVLLIGKILGFIPGVGDTIEAIFAIIAVWLIYQGWKNILFGLDKAGCTENASL